MSLGTVGADKHVTLNGTWHETVSMALACKADSRSVANRKRTAGWLEVGEHYPSRLSSTSGLRKTLSASEHCTRAATRRASRMTKDIDRAEADDEQTATASLIAAQASTSTTTISRAKRDSGAFLDLPTDVASSLSTTPVEMRLRAHLDGLKARASRSARSGCGA